MAPALLSLVLVTLWIFFVCPAGCLQCYSCKASGPNEMDANIQCLEKAYLESCDEFYNYYNDVEEELYDYYYNFDDDASGDVTGNAPETQGEDAEQGPQNDVSKVDALPADSAQAQNTPSDIAAGGMAHPGHLQIRRKRRGASSRASNSSQSAEDEERDYSSHEASYEYESNESYDEDDHEGRSGGRGRSRGRGHRGRGHGGGGRGRGHGGRHRSRDDSYEYEYEYYDDVTTPDVKTTTGLVTTAKAPAKPEHFCYSVTEKTGWETYTVEKGCKKIVYCKDALANKPAWAHPWNFCCDRSRCNVKLVKDKPQRVFGMGCRRTDDCIQGHNTRPVCPHFFKACPRISRSLVKMECRAQSRTMASVKGGLKYRAGKEKKCYCSKGYFPKGPICTSVATSHLPVPVLVVMQVVVTSLRL